MTASSGGEGKATALHSVFSLFSSGSHPWHGSLHVGVGGGEVRAEALGKAEKHAATKDGKRGIVKNLLCG